MEQTNIGNTIKLTATDGLIHKIGTDIYVHSILMLPNETIDMYEEVTEKPEYTKNDITEEDKVRLDSLPTPSAPDLTQAIKEEFLYDLLVSKYPEAQITHAEGGALIPFNIDEYPYTYETALQYYHNGPIEEPSEES